MTPEVKPRRVAYLFVLGFLLLAGIPSVLMFFEGLEGVRDPLLRMRAPGTDSVVFDEAGHWTAFYEYESEIEGETISTHPDAPPMTITITSEGGEEIVAGEGAGSLTYNYERAGLSVAAFDIDEPGTYSVAVESDTGEAVDPFVVAFGHEKVRSVGQLIFGVILIGSTLLVVLIATGIIFFLRVRSKRRAQLAQSGFGLPPPPPGF